MRGWLWCVLVLHSGGDVARGAGFVAPLTSWSDFAASRLWDDGRAEVALYDVSGSRYGLERAFEAITVVVKEPFDLERHVKAAAGQDGRSTEVLKLNHEVTLPTGVYSYRQMATLQLRRSDLEPLKLTTTSQELCGITTKHWRSDHPDRLRTHSYFDGEGDRDHELPADEAWVFYDALPLKLRSMTPSAEPLELRLLPPQLSNRAPAPELAPAVLRWGGIEELATPVGAISVRQVTLEHAGGQDVFSLQEDFPHILVRWQQADGTTYLLRNMRRIAYWRRTKPGDRELLERPDPVRSLAIP